MDFSLQALAFGLFLEFLLQAVAFGCSFRLLSVFRKRQNMQCKSCLVIKIILILFGDGFLETPQSS